MKNILGVIYRLTATHAEQAAMKTNEEIRAAVEGAFRPLRCVVEIWDFGKKLSFRVSDERDHTVLTAPDEVLENLRDGPGLEVLINDSRSRIAEHGYHLDPWQKT